jgi:hypothetical protein
VHEYSRLVNNSGATYWNEPRREEDGLDGSISLA